MYGVLRDVQWKMQLTAGHARKASSAHLGQPDVAAISDAPKTCACTGTMARNEEIAWYAL